MKKIIIVLIGSIFILFFSMVVFYCYSNNKIVFNIDGKDYIVDKNNEINCLDYDTEKDLIVLKKSFWYSSFIGNNKLSFNKKINLGKVNDNYLVIDIKSLLGNNREIVVNLRDNNYSKDTKLKKDISFYELLSVIIMLLLFSMFVLWHRKRRFL